MTEKPSPPRRSATAAPIPRDAPVTMATLPFCSLMALLPMCAELRVDRRQNSYSIRGDNLAKSGNIIRISRTTGWPMDRIDAMRLFARVVERRSFTLAAQDLAVPRSTATEVVKQLEARLGVRLLP